MQSEPLLNGAVRLFHGDSRDVLKSMADASVDSVVTDPPYALVSIVKRFGGEGAAPAKDGDVYARSSAGFMGQQWDTGETAFAVEFWAQVFRVLKPGGHVIAFSGTRTYHRLAVAIEDAGFEIRDMLQWLYGSGFPKSHDVSKGIDKALGFEREVVGHQKLTGAARIKGGSGYTVESAADNYATAEVRDSAPITIPASLDAAAWQGWGTALKPACEPMVMARKPLIGTVAANVLAHGTGAINIDACRVPAEKPTGWGGGGSALHEGGLSREGGEGRPVDGRWPANVLHDGSPEVVAGFPDARSSGGGGRSTGERGGAGAIWGSTSIGHDGSAAQFHDSGSAARFFYSAKADGMDRVGSGHPTVKPVDLMEWACRLVTPPGGVTLDPFAGSGSTGEAAFRGGFQSILIEREAAYCEDIRRRMELATAGDKSKRRAIAKHKAKPEESGPGALFA